MPLIQSQGGMPTTHPGEPFPGADPDFLPLQGAGGRWSKGRSTLDGIRTRSYTALNRARLPVAARAHERSARTFTAAHSEDARGRSPGPSSSEMNPHRLVGTPILFATSEPRIGIEPMTSPLRMACSYRLSYGGIVPGHRRRPVASQ